MKKLFATLLTLTLMLALAGCGASNGMYNTAAPEASNSMKGGYYDGYDYAEESEPYWEAPAEYAVDGGEPRASLPEGVKMVYTANLTMQTTEFDRAAADIATLVEQLGGYFEQRSVRDYSSGYRYANYTVRIPSAQFRAFLDHVGTLCHVTDSTDSADNISERYYDTQSRLETARIKLERLQELLSKAENMSDIITIESAISETEYEIESLSGTLRRYDALVDYATVNMSLSEVYRLTETETAPMTFAQRIASAFREGLSDFADALGSFAEWLAYSWLTLLVLAAAAVLIVRLVRRARSRRDGERKPRKERKARGKQGIEDPADAGGKEP